MKFSLTRNTFLKASGVLFTGTLVSQVISYALSPIISRQFSPEDAAYLGMFLRITSLGAAIATARLELAFPMQKLEHHAFGLYRFAVHFSLVISLISLILVGSYGFVFFESWHSIFFYVSIPLGIFLTANYNMGTNWALRNEDYGLISRATVLQSLISNGLKVLLGIFSSHYLVLVGTTVLAMFAGGFEFLRDFLRGKRGSILVKNSKRTKALLAHNSDLYFFNLPHVFVDLGRDLVLGVIIWHIFDQFTFGSFDHAVRMLRLPMILVGSAIGQVFFRKCSHLLHEKKDLLSITRKTVLGLAAVSCIPFFVLFLFCGEIFAFVFGEEWRASGEIAKYLIPWFYVNLLVSPISHLPVLLNKQKSYFWVNVGGTVFVLGSLLLPFFFPTWFTQQQAFIFISGAHCVFISFLLFWFFYQVKKTQLKT